MNVVILAAGYGTRLYPLTINLPKPLVSINKKPIINFLIDKIKPLQKSGIVKNVHVVCNDKFYKTFLAWKKKYKFKVKIVNDGTTTPENRLGAIGDIIYAIKDKKDVDWLVLGGDNLFDGDLVDFVKFAKKNKSYATIGLHKVSTKKEATRFGVVQLNNRNRVVDFSEKPSRPTSKLVATCIYYFPKDSLKLLDIFIAEDHHYDASGRYIKWLARKSKVIGYVFNGKWIDIGHHDALKQAEKEFK